MSWRQLLPVCFGRSSQNRADVLGMIKDRSAPTTSTCDFQDIGQRSTSTLTLPELSSYSHSLWNDLGLRRKRLWSFASTASVFTDIHTTTTDKPRIHSLLALIDGGHWNPAYCIAHCGTTLTARYRCCGSALHRYRSLMLAATIDHAWKNTRIAGRACVPEPRPARFDEEHHRRFSTDNMTVLLHLEGSSGLQNQALMMYIAVFAYGENRFDLTVDPCAANIGSLCPANSSVPIQATDIIPVSPSDVADIPPIALNIPDFEGQAIVRIFANETQSEIACFSAALTNGNSFSHPAPVGSVLGVFTFIALCASFITSAYGAAVPTMRLHYAHSLSVGVVFAVFQHIYFTGALSMNWPSVLVAWWSNFAWAGGMIYSSSMQSSIDNLIGTNVGNTTEVGAASVGATENIGGDFDITQIYKRTFEHGDITANIFGRTPGTFSKRNMMHGLHSRAVGNVSSGYDWYGTPVRAGLPLPGNYSGFAGTLAQQEIPASNAFMTGFLWFLILFAILIAAIVIFKWALEGFARVKAIKQDRLKFFRDHWLMYTRSLALRTFYLAFFMMMFLTIFQFTYSSSDGVKAIAAIVFIIFLVGVIALALQAVLSKKTKDGLDSKSRFRIERRTLLSGKVPWYSINRNHLDPEAHFDQPIESQERPKFAWARMKSVMSLHTEEPKVDQSHNIHDDEEYIMKHGWLAARFRRSRWWFFTAWIGYEFLRAAFYGGASGSPLVQTFGLLVIECLAFVFVLWAKPFEGRRLNVLVVYCLGISKIATVALSAAFDVQFNLQRIATTAIGIVIIVIQGILTIITMIAILVGAISSYMSISRNREEFRPRRWANMREKYYDHLDRVVNDLPREPKPKKAPLVPLEPEEPKEPHFEMRNVRRVAKIEDDDKEFASEMRSEMYPQHQMLDGTPTRPHSMTRTGGASPVSRSRATSINSTKRNSLPYGARPHRPSWSAKDFQDISRSLTAVDMSRAVADEEMSPTAGPSRPRSVHSRTPSRGTALPSPKLRPQASDESIQLGGDASSRDMIGRVPAPTNRPRTGSHGSHGSRRGSRNMTLLGGQQDVSGENMTEAANSSRRTWGYQPMTPAQEMDEWIGSSPRRPDDGAR
nr:putative membrane protein [Quercus suber]